MTNPAAIAAEAALGLCLGSFAATAAIRWARGEAFVAGRSHCDGCGGALGGAATIPVLSYAIRRGACRACGARLDRLHPIGEIAGAVIVAGAVTVVGWPRGVLAAGLGLTLLASALIDLKTQRLPDALSLLSLGWAAALAMTRSAGDLVTGLVCGAVTFAVLEGLRRFYLSVRGRPGLGGGDVKLAAALAVWLGLATPWALTAASLLALGAIVVVRPANGRLAFGPAIALGAFVIGLGQEGLAWPLPA